MSNNNELQILQRALKREKEARKTAEKILEEKSRSLYYLSEELKITNNKLSNLLEEKSSQLQGFFDNILDAYIVMNLKGHVLKMNDAAKDLFGYDIDKERLNVINLIYKEDEEYAFNSFYELTQKGFYSNYTARVITKTNEVKWVQINASIIYNKAKEPIAAQGIIRDITQDKKDEDLLIESKNRLSSLISNLDSAVLLEDANRNIIFTNQKFCDIFKIPLSPDNLKGVSCKNYAEQSKNLFVAPDTFIKKLNLLLKEQNKVLGQEYIMVDGTILVQDFIPIKKGDKIDGFLWCYRDVTLQKNYSKSLESQKNKYSNIIANMNLGLVEIDINGDILLVNQTLCDMSGYPKKELLGRRISKLLPYSGAQDVIEKQHKKRLKGESNSYEIKVKTKKRKIRHWLVSGAPNYGLNGEISGTIGICLDITNLKTLEKQKERILKELEKRNNELEEYAHIVSHDLKSPLRSISALTSWIKTDNEGKLDKLTLENFNLIEITLEKMEQLISDILIYSSAGVQNKEKQEVNIQTLVEDLKKILYVPKHVSINILNKLPIITGDRVKFQQLFQNLISNAVKFCDSEKGIIEVDVKESQSFYEFSIKDNGIGIEKKYHKKIFKIFHSLQESKSSTGIGLSIVKKIIDLYKGEIWIESAPNEGTIFFFTIKKN